MAIYITVRAVLAAGDYASVVCVPLALRYTMKKVRALSMRKKNEPVKQPMVRKIK